MKLICIRLVLVLLAFGLVRESAFAQRMEKNETSWFSWKNGTPLPVPEGLSAGCIGMQGETMIYAGGSDFDKPKWEGGSKKYHSGIYVLKKPAQAGEKWTKAGELPHTLADAATVDTPEGLLCLGGTDGTTTFADVFLLRWNASAKQVKLETGFPELPVACADAAAERIGDWVYVVGGKTTDNKPLNTVWRLNVQTRKEWEILPVLPGPARFGAALVRQSNGETDCLYLMGGKSESTYLKDVYVFNPKTTSSENGWKRLADMPRPALLAPATALGPTHIVLFSGSDGHDLDKIPHIKSTKDYQFTTEVLAYHTITNTWTPVSQMPLGLVGSRALVHGKQIFLPGGEICPSVRTPLLQVADFSGLTAKANFAWLDYGALAGYFVLISGISVWFSRRKKKSTDQFLRGGQSMPFWAVGISVMATQVSAIGFMTIPAKSYATNWAYFAGVATWFIVVPIVNWAFIPFYRKLNLTSAYQYLEARFDKRVRLVAATFFLFFQLTRMGLVLYLPSLALSAVMPIDMVTSIILMGLFSTLYTVLGGIEAVIWIEVAQAILLFGGAFLCVMLAINGLEGGVSQFFEIALTDQKFDWGTTSWSWTSTALGIILIGNIFNRLGNLSSDQAIVQRYMTTPNLAESRKTLWADVAASIPWAILIYGVGTALYVFYKQSPQLLIPTLSTDSILPAFISQKAPAGISGLIIAGVFAAAMASLEGSIHSVATISYTDFYSHLRPNLSDTAKLSFLKRMTWTLGGFATLISLLLMRLNLTSLLDFFTQLLGLFVGASMGLFFLGIFTRRANATGALAGVAGSGLIMTYVTFFTPLSFWLYSALGLLSCFSIGLLVSLITGGATKHDGLTIYSKETTLPTIQKESNPVTVTP